MPDNRAHYSIFAQNKRDFLTQVTTQTTFQMVEQRARQVNYGNFIADNKQLIEQEFEQLYESLKALAQRDQQNLEAFWLYCYYCCLLLENYHRAYGQDERASHFEKLESSIRECLVNGVSLANQVQDSFWESLKKAIKESLSDLTSTLLHIAKIKDKISISNIYRIYWFFCRTSVTKSFLLARDLQWLDKLGGLLGKQIDADHIISILEKPNGFFRFLSVGFFAARFLINAAMILKHSLMPGDAESGLTKGKRFYYEIYKRHPQMLNDVVWGAVNLLTNYNELFHIAAPVAAWTVVGFMFFDFCLFMWKRYLAEQEYLLKKVQYEDELNGYGAPLTDAHKALLIEQDRRLDSVWQAKNETFWFNATAALLIMTGFSASMILTPAVMVLGCYMVCTFAVAMYLSEEEFNNYRLKASLLQHAGFNGEGALVDQPAQQTAQNNYVKARNDFVLTMAKNVIMPSLVIATVAICWQAALVLAAGYLSYQLWSAYSEHTEQQAKPESLNAVPAR